MFGYVHDDVEITVAALSRRTTTSEFDLRAIFDACRNASSCSVGIYFSAEKSVTKRDCRFGLQILTATWAALTTTKEGGEDVIRAVAAGELITEVTLCAKSTWTAVSAHVGWDSTTANGVAHLVVIRALLIVRQDFVSLGDRFKALFQFLIALGLVRVKLARKFAVLLFYLRRVI